jgi:FkbM family methyltransferase
MVEALEHVDMHRRHALVGWLRGIDVIGVRALSHLVPKLIIPPPRHEMVMRTVHGFDLRIDPVHDRGVERSIYYTGSYERGTLFMLSHLLRPGDTFVDVGANIGLMSIHASRCVGGRGRVIAFEPQPATRAMLEYNLRINNVVNVEVIPNAVGAVRGRATIYEDPGANRGRSSLIQPEGAMNGDEVDVVRLDEVLAGRLPIRLVKLDIEGFELEALKGMGALLRSDDRPMLMIECSEERENSHGQGTKAIHDLLEQVGGYRFFRPRRGKERPSRLIELHGHREFPAHDNVYCLTDRHVSSLSDVDILEKSLR